MTDALRERTLDEPVWVSIREAVLGEVTRWGEPAKSTQSALRMTQTPPSGRRITEPTDQPTSVAQRLREVTAREAAARGQRFDLVAQLRNEHGWSWQQIGAELGITKQGALKAYAAHVQEGVRRNTATDRAPFEVVRPSVPVASPVVDVPLDLD